MIPQAFIQDLISRADIVEIVGRYVELKKAGINHKGLCPFHGEKTPSFIVSPTRQTYHCFGCGVHGNALGFLMEHGGMGFLDAVRDLAQQLGMAVPEDERSPEERQQAAKLRERQTTITEALERAADHYRKQLKGNQRAVQYLKGRGLTGEIAARFGLGYAPPGWHALASAFAEYDDPVLEEAGLVITQGDEGGEKAKRYDRFRDRIMFPIRAVQGEVIGFGGRVLDSGEPKYLNSPETPVFVKGRELYGLFEARSAVRAKGYVLVVEGYMDVVALAQLGFENAVATLGTACTEDHVRKLFRFTESVVFSFDGDAAGRRAAGRALEAALPHASDTRTVRFLFLPPEHDPDSFIREQGPEAFEAVVQQAVPLSRQLVETAREGCDLATAEGRARMLAQAKPLWSALPEGALRRQVMGEFAKLGELPAEELASLWTGRGSGGKPKPAPSQMQAQGTAEPRELRRGGPPLSMRRAPVNLRQPPRRPEDRIVHMLFTQSAWWEQLTVEDHELLHSLPAPHGLLLAWLERHLLDHGPGPWAALAPALNEDPALADAIARLMPNDPDHDETGFEDMRRALDQLLLRSLEARKDALAPHVQNDPEARAQYKELDLRWRDLKSRQEAAKRSE